MGLVLVGVVAWFVAANRAMREGIRMLSPPPDADLIQVMLEQAVPIAREAVRNAVPNVQRALFALWALALADTIRLGWRAYRGAGDSTEKAGLDPAENQGGKKDV